MKKRARKLKAAKKLPPKKPALVSESPRSDDPFDVIGPIPKGKSYQWLAFSVMGKDITDWPSFKDAFKAGWKPVPSRRHPLMPNKKGRIVYGAQILVERPHVLTTKAWAKDFAAAKKLVADNDAGSGQPYHAGGRFPSKDAPDPSASDGSDCSTRIDAARNKFEALGSSVPVTIKIALTNSQVEASGIVDLSLEEYTRRAVLMGRAWSNGPICLIEVGEGVFQFAQLNIKD